MPRISIKKKCVGLDFASFVLFLLLFSLGAEYKPRCCDLEWFVVYALRLLLLCLRSAIL